MNLKDEIKSSFKSEKQKALVNILYTSNALSLVFNGLFKKFNISKEQYNVLRILRGQHPKPSSINVICERMLDKSSNASRLVEKLRLKELVERVSCPEDRRQVNVTITDLGLSLLEEIEIDLVPLENKIGNLNSNELEELNRLLDRFRESY